MAGTGTGKARNVAFVTFGCRLNKAEALDLEAQYAAAGWNVIDGAVFRGQSSGAANGSKLQAPRPDLIIVRGCSVTAKAQRDCEKAIAHLRSRFPGAEIRITGCLPDKVKDEGEWKGEGESTYSHGDTETRRKRHETSVRSVAPCEKKNSTSQPTSRAYLKVQDGCSGRCAFCIVPQVRGAPVSVPFRDVLARARAFLSAGFREIILTGCNLCLYRYGGHGLAELAAAIAALESPGHRVRLGSVEPGICDGRIVDALEAHPNICRFLHLSLQSGSDGVLRRMRRPYTAGEVAAFCEEARRRIGPRLAFGADVIAGFPGESAADHEATLGMVRGQGFVHVHAFPFSERPGTEAAEMPGALPRAVRRERARELALAGAANRETFARALIGGEVEVCVERDGNGRTDEGLRCLLEGAAGRRSLVHATVKKYFPKSGAICATIRTVEQQGGKGDDDT